MLQEDIQPCSSIEGHIGCAVKTLRTHLKKKRGCPGKCADCISLNKSHPMADKDRAAAFRDTPANALRYLGHCRNELSRNPSQKTT